MLTEGRIQGHEVQQLVEFAKEMLRAPIRLLDGAEHTIRTVASRHTVILVTKGDLFDQESKLARSGLGDLFSNVEVVSAKNRATYEGIALRLGFTPSRFVMVGDSLKSDILPVIEMGGHAIHVPYGTTWEHEQVAPDVAGRYEFLQARKIGEVPAMLDNMR